MKAHTISLEGSWIKNQDGQRKTLKPDNSEYEIMGLRWQSNDIIHFATLFKASKRENGKLQKKKKKEWKNGRHKVYDPQSN